MVFSWMKFILASTDEDRTVETCFDVPMFSVLKEYSTFSINHVSFHCYTDIERLAVCKIHVHTRCYFREL